MGTVAELGAVAGVGVSTLSVHMHRLEAAHLINVRRQGKNRYYSLDSSEVVGVLQRLSALPGGHAMSA